jgi:hypothetical protein
MTESQLLIQCLVLKAELKIANSYIAYLELRGRKLYDETEANKARNRKSRSRSADIPISLPEVTKLLEKY